MDFDYVVIPSVIVLLGLVTAWLSIQRLLLQARAEPTWRNVVKRITLLVVAVVALCIAGTSGLNAFALYVNRLKLPGQTYLVDGHKMRIDCTGSGSPTLILEAGGGHDGFDWGGVQPVLAQTTRVCSYDRAGLGGSDRLPSPRDADHVVTELHRLLRAAHVDSPIVLMGASVGGLFIRDYTTHFPGEVAGLIFVDSSVPSQNRNLVFLAHFDNIWSRKFDIMLSRTTLILGIPRLLGMCSKARLGGFDSRAAKILAEDRCHEPFGAMADEANSFDRSAEETLHTGPYGALPVLIFSHDPAAEDPENRMVDLEKASDQMHEDLKTLSTRSRRIIAKGSLHFIHLDRPDLIEREVSLFIEQIRGTAPKPTYGSTVTE